MILGIDVGGTAIKALVTDSAGVVSAETTWPTPKTIDELVATVAAIVAELGATVANSTATAIGSAPSSPSVTPIPARIGICVPGIVDEIGGIGVKAANMPWHNTPLRELFAAAIGRKVSLGHDVRCGARAEARWGAGSANCLFVAIGTGIAAVPIVSGNPLPGIWAGEVGQPLVRDPASGEYVSVERVSSAAAIANRYRERYPGRIPAAGGAKDVLDLARLGDSGAADVWHEAIEVLAEMLVYATAVTAPEQIVLAGGLALAGADLMQPLQAALAARCGVLPVPTLATTTLGLRGQALGAAALTLED